METILILSHSACHPRQTRFYLELSNHFDLVAVIGPRSWNRSKLSIQDMTFDKYLIRGLPVSNEMNLELFRFQALEQVVSSLNKTFDYVYVQDEWWSRTAQDALALARKLNAKAILFTWENIRIPEPEQVKHFDFIIAGNIEAGGNLIAGGYPSKKIAFLPQVGIDTFLFSPKPVKKEFDVVFAGRPVVEKGIQIIQEGCAKIGARLLILCDLDYEQVPERLSSAHIFASLPMATQTWKEQCGYAALEAMACGLPVITTNSGSVLDYMDPNIAMIIPESWAKDHFAGACKDFLAVKNSARFCQRSQEGRDYVCANYSNLIIAKEVADAIKAIS